MFPTQPLYLPYNSWVLDHISLLISSYVWISSNDWKGVCVSPITKGMRYPRKGQLISRRFVSQWFCIFPYTGTRSTVVQHSSTVGKRLGDHPTRQNVGRLGTIIQQLFLAGVADFTRNTYRSGSDRYIRLYATLGITLFPVSERSILLFVASLYSEGLAGITAKTYLSESALHRFLLGGGGRKIPTLGACHT